MIGWGVCGAQQQEAGGGALVEHQSALPVFCCWDGLAVLRAEPFYRGLRFRSVPRGQGVLSECSNLCLDLWANGYRRVVVDPQVKLTYDEPSYERLHARMPPRYLPDLYHVDTSRLPATPPPPPDTVSHPHPSIYSGSGRTGPLVGWWAAARSDPAAGGRAVLYVCGGMWCVCGVAVVDVLPGAWPPALCLHGALRPLLRPAPLPGQRHTPRHALLPAAPPHPRRRLVVLLLDQPHEYVRQAGRQHRPTTDDTTADHC